MPVTVRLPASNIGGVEKYAEVLLTGPASGSGDGAADWLTSVFASLAEDITVAVMSEVEEYAQPGDEEAGRAVGRVAKDAVAGFAARLAATAAAEAAVLAEPPEAAVLAEAASAA